MKCREIPARRDVEEIVEDVVVREYDMLLWFIVLVEARTDCCIQVRNRLDDIAKGKKERQTAGKYSIQIAEIQAGTIVTE